MKTLFYTKTLIALAVAVAAAACAVSQAQEQPIPPPVSGSALPPNIAPGTPLAEVVKMVQAAVDVATINNYIINSQSAFNLDADKIIYLKDEGVPSELVNAMLERDKILYAGSVAPAPAPAGSVASAPDSAPPPAEVSMDYFYDSLAPYGSWVMVAGYGRCWRPTVVNYDSGWRPYCDRGHWIFTDYGWYWDSDYSWGATFHYGRWFRNARFGWCWYPETIWAPSWVTWRSAGDYCGWAPLPPFAEFRPGFGFFYHGTGVAIDFDFGLDAGCFSFVSQSHFCDRRPRDFCFERTRVAQIFQQTIVINNFNIHNTTMVNNGIAVQQIIAGLHRPIQPVPVAGLPNAGHHGFRGDVHTPAAPLAAGGGRFSTGGNGQLRHGPALLNNNQNNNQNLNSGASLHPYSGSPVSGANPGGKPVLSTHPPLTESPGTHPGYSHSQLPLEGVKPPANNNNDNRQNVFRNQHSEIAPVTGGSQFQPLPKPTTPLNVAPPDHRTLPNNWSTGGNDPVRSQNNTHQQIQTPPSQHPAAQLEQHSFIAPVQPHLEAAPRSYTPPPALAPATSPDRSYSKDKQNH